LEAEFCADSSGAIETRNGLDLTSRFMIEWNEPSHAKGSNVSLSKLIGNSRCQWAGNSLKPRGPFTWREFRDISRMPFIESVLVDNGSKATSCLA
jgi:hypothetical protein